MFVVWAQHSTTSIPKKFYLVVLFPSCIVQDDDAIILSLSIIYYSRARQSRFFLGIIEYIKQMALPLVTYSCCCATSLARQAPTPSSIFQKFSIQPVFFFILPRRLAAHTIFGCGCGCFFFSSRYYLSYTTTRIARPPSFVPNDVTLVIASHVP